MKTLGKIKLNQLSKDELQKREMNSLKGGACCACGCRGSSSTLDNGNANLEYGYYPGDGGPGVGGTA